MIDNPRSPRVRAVAKLAKKQARVESGLYLLEGPQAVSEAFAAQPECLEELYATPTALERHPQLRADAERHGVELEYVTEQVLDAMADTVTPQGVIAVARQTPTSVKDVFRLEPRLLAILEEVRDPGNAGTIIRAADAAGADAVILTGRSVDLYNPKLVRSTTGSLFHLPVATGASLEDVLERARAAGIRVLAADMAGDALPDVRAEGALAEPTAWLFGNEARGLSDEHAALADRVVSVPIYGAAESLNLAVAASVCLYETAFAQRT
jgi:RNA methyltransferase, TrmH family